MTDYYVFDLKEFSKEEIFKKAIPIFIENENLTIMVLNAGQFITRINYEKCLRHFNLSQRIDEITDNEYSYDCILDSDKKILSVIKNKNYEEKYDYRMRKNRWDVLYKNNNYFINFLKKCAGNKILVTGEYALDIYYYIKKYGTDIEIEKVDNDYFLKICDCYENWYVIDTNNMSNEIRKRMIGNNSYHKLIEICDAIEVEKFRQFYLSRGANNFVFVEVPTTTEFLKLTLDEKKRMNSNRNYKSFLQDKSTEIIELKKRFLGKYYDYKMIEDICYPATVLLINGLLSQQSFTNDNFHIINGKRVTTNNIVDAIQNVNFYGNCIVFGQMVDDFNTIPSCFQRLLNENGIRVNAINYGIRSNTLIETIRNINYNGIFSSDLHIIFYLDEERDVIRELGIEKVFYLYEVLNDIDVRDYFLDTPLHCNYIANKKISRYLYEGIKEKLKQQLSLSGKLLLPNYEKNLYEGNKYVSKYIDFLKRNSRNGINGGIVINGNPFTNGHLNLIKFASEMVDTLYVFVIQEDRSIFKFEDRLKMARESCAFIKNVVVLPSGEFLGSAMLFPEYGSKSSDQDVKVDCLDDTEFFCKIVSPLLNIKYRFVGEEKTDMITNHLNDELKSELPKYGISLIEKPRFSSEQGRVFSASYVRMLISEHRLEELADYVPKEVLKIIYENGYVKKLHDTLKKEKILSKFKRS